MQRREFVALSGALLAPQKKTAVPPPPPPPGDQVRELFLDITRGFLANAGKTSPSMAVVEYPGATVTKNFLAKSGLSATGVTRMLPAMAAWVAGRREPGLQLTDALIKAFKNGCDPGHADYWLPSLEKTSNQRQVESGIIAWSLWLTQEQVMPALGAEGRRNVAAWLASCTQVPVRNNNWAWFTAVNLAARMRFAEKWPEFSSDEKFMLDDLKVLDSMATGDSGWYNDGFKGFAYDYYNSWVFASHFLYWNEMVGDRYPEWRKKFSDRLTRYLEMTPYFFAGHGGHVLYGRSLIYRWGVLTPLVLAYQQKLWPHSPGLLRRIVQQDILWQAGLGGFDKTAGKLRETFTPDGSPAIKETYIDGGHPYWGMQAFAFWRTPDNDPFWTAPEEKLPIEKSDFSIALPEPGLLLVGTRQSGQVRIFNGRSTRTDTHYRDKYNKLVYSSHFPFAGTHGKDDAPIDQTLALRDRKTGKTATRGEITDSTVETEKLDLEYPIVLGGVTAKVRTEIHFMGDFEARIHRITCEGTGLEEIDVVEGGAAFSPTSAYKDAHLKTWSLKGWQSNKTEDADGSVMWGKCQIQVLIAPAAKQMYLVSMRYQSPKGFTKDKIDGEATSLLKRLNL